MTGILKDQCKKYLGVKPYDEDTNVVKHDIYFLVQLQNTYGKETVEKAMCETMEETHKEKN